LRTYLAGSLDGGGLGKHSVDELATVLAGRSAALQFGRSTDSFTASSITTPRDLLLQMQLTAALITDPGYRPESIERFRKGIDNFYNTIDATPGRALAAAQGRVIHDNDPRFALQPKEAFFALDFEQLKDVIGDRLASGAIEIALVGDLDEAEAIAAVAATFGALPMREADFNPRNEARVVQFTPERGERVLTHKGEPDQALLHWVWPTTDDSDLAEAMRLNLLARIVRLELTDRLREQLGQAYSPSANSDTSEDYPGFGTFTISTSVAVDQVGASREALNRLVADLRKAPLDQDIIERARKPYFESYNNYLKDLGGWLALSARAQSKPEKIDRYFASPDMMRAITPEDIHQTALKYLTPDGAVAFTVLPETAAGEAKDE
jgi:zinc protease